MINDPDKYRVIVALVEKIFDEVYEYSPANPKNAGRQSAVVRIASKAGGEVKIAWTARGGEAKIAKGDLVSRF